MKTCPKCRLSVKWKNSGGRWRLLDPDGKEHFDTCAKEWWRIVSTLGTRFETEDNSGYLLHGKKFYDWKRGPVITGIHFPWPDLPYVKSESPWKTKER